MNWHPARATAAICTVSGTLIVSVACGEIIAEDNASNAAYAKDGNGAWLGTNPTADENPPGDDNGGFGFLPWSFTGGYHLPMLSPYGNLNHFIDGVDFTASTFNDLGSPAFALTNAQSGSGVTARARRAFEHPLGVGDVLSFQFDTPAVLEPFSQFGSPSVNMRFLGSSGSTTFDIGAGVYSTGPTRQVFPWRIMDGSGSLNTQISPFDTSDGSSLSLEVTSQTTASLTFDGQTFEIALSNGPPASVLFQLYQNTSGDGVIPPLGEPTGEREFFFNDFRIESPDSILVGDYNGDGAVNTADYTVWRDNLGASMALPNEGDSPGIVDAADYAVWKTNFTALPAPSTTIAAAPVPEPKSIMLLIVGAGLCSCRQATSS